MSLSCFKAYDIRGTYPSTLNESIAYAVGLAFAETLGAKNVAVGYDARLSGPALRDALLLGLEDAGARATCIGMCGTEEIYYAAAKEGFDGGLMITGSHNPADDNGIKMVRAGAVPVSGDSGLNDIRDAAEKILASGARVPSRVPAVRHASFRARYVRYLLDLTGADKAPRPLNIHADAGNGCAGLALKELLPFLPHKVTSANMEPDGRFPNGVPNPLLPERRAETSRAVRENGADFGVAWDGDFDRCFFYDGEGNFIEGYYLVGLLAESMLQKFPGAKIIHDPRLIWNTRDVVRRAGGTPVMSKTGHAFIKERMRAEDAVYGGEMSAHHYFRDFGYCDSGMIPFLLVSELVSRSGRTLAELVSDRMRAFPCSGEINSKVGDARAVIASVYKTFRPQAKDEDRTDGLSLVFDNWRFNLRSSNTEPLLRLNVESKGDAALMEEKTGELLALIRGEAVARV